MKILFLTERYPPRKGGVAVAAARQARLLGSRVERLDVLHAVSGLSAGRVEAELEGGVHVHRLGEAPAREDTLALLSEAAMALARRHRHDLLVGFYAVHAGYVAVLTARRLGIPAVVSVRGNDLDRGLFQGSRFPLLRWTLRHAAAVIGVSRELLEKTAALTGREDGLDFVGNGVDAKFFCPGAPDPAHLEALASRPRPWVCFAGEARLKKGLPVLEQVAAELARRDLGTLFLVGGVRRDERAGFERWRLACPAAAARLVEVPYLRDRERLLSHYRGMDIFVFPSLFDGMPNALLEVMACGRPVLASHAGGIVDVIEDGRSGILVPVDELDRFPAALALLAEGLEESRLALGRAARARVLELFDEETEAAGLLRVCRRAAGEEGA